MPTSFTLKLTVCITSDFKNSVATIRLSTQCTCSWNTTVSHRSVLRVSSWFAAWSCCQEECLKNASSLKGHVASRVLLIALLYLLVNSPIKRRLYFKATSKRCFGYPIHRNKRSEEQKTVDREGAFVPGGEPLLTRNFCFLSLQSPPL